MFHLNTHKISVYWKTIFEMHFICIYLYVCHVLPTKHKHLICMYVMSPHFLSTYIYLCLLIIALSYSFNKLQLL